MRRVGFVLALLALGGWVSAAQQPAPAENQAPPKMALETGPKPAPDGAYFVGPQVTAPRLVHTMAAGYPAGVRSNEVAGFTVISTIIDVKGVPTAIEVLHTHGEEFDASAINAVKLSRFAPGMLTASGAQGSKPVPVRIDVRIPFHANHAQAIPVVVIAERDLSPPDITKGKHPSSYTPPIPIHTVDADFVDPTAKTAYEAVALVTVTVSAEGLPTDVRLRRGLGFGTDAKAVAAVKQYRFLPATSNGKPIAASREVEVKFTMF